VLAPVHDAHDRRTGVWSDLHEVERQLLCGFTGLLKGNDADLLAFGVDEADGADPDLVVDAWVGDRMSSLWVWIGRFMDAALGPKMIRPAGNEQVPAQRFGRRWRPTS
jgi:hypothetical protein